MDVSVMRTLNELALFAGGEAASWQGSCLDGAPYALLKLMPEQGLFCLTGKLTAVCRHFPSGTMFAPLTASHGVEKLMSLQADSLVKTSVLPEKGRALMEPGAGCGQKWRESLARFDPASCSLKTAQLCLLGDSSESLPTLPPWGFMQDGECFELPALERRTTDPGFTFLLTSTAQSWKAWTFRNPLSLIRKNHADGNLQEQLMRLYQRMITPRCQEILMMWPEGWTDSKPLETAGFRRWLQEHSLICRD